MPKVIFTISNYVGPSIIASSTLNKLDLSRINGEEDANLLSVKELPFDIKGHKSRNEWA